jgi:hypothetical protein
MYRTALACGQANEEICYRIIDPFWLCHREGPQARHYVAQVVSEVRRFSKKSRTEEKGLGTDFLPEAGA